MLEAIHLLALWLQLTEAMLAQVEQIQAAEAALAGMLYAPCFLDHRAALVQRAQAHLAAQLATLQAAAVVAAESRQLRQPQMAAQVGPLAIFLREDRQSLDLLRAAMEAPTST